MSQVTVNVIDTPVASGVASGAATRFVIGQTERGTITAPIVCRSLAEVKAKTGQRVSYGFVYDDAEFFFKMGGSLYIIGRCVGPAAAAATHTFADGSSNPALTVKANSPGGWGNGSSGGLSVAITAGVGGGTFVVNVSYGGVLKETSPDLADAAAAIAWAAANSTYVTITDPGAVGDPAVITAQNLSGGTDDRTNVTTTQWTAARNLLTPDLGQGTVSAPGITTTAVQQLIIDNGEFANRIPLLDLVDVASSASVAATISSLTGTGRRRTCACAPWVVVPGLTPGSTRTIPSSGVIAGRMAASDGDGAVPNIDDAIAGDNGILDVVLGLSQTWTNTDRAALAAVRINPIIINEAGQAQVDGNLTLGDPLTYPAWVEVSAARTLMYVIDGCKTILGRFRYKTLDPERVTIGKLGVALEAFLQSLSDKGFLYNDPGTAVDVGPQVNTPTTISAKQLLANVVAQPSPSAEEVTLNLYAEAV